MNGDPITRQRSAWQVDRLGLPWHVVIDWVMSA